MAQILVRDLSLKTVDKLKRRARENSRSLHSEVKRILEDAAGRMTPAEFRKLAGRIRRSFGQRKFSNSALIIRGDRDR
ncbi:MAG: FitA-like ribbon-helix-helix domain-containing protein [Thermoanaerobaculia bacterium]